MEEVTDVAHPLPDEEERSLERYRQQVSSSGYQRRLKGASADYLKPEQFAAGDPVTWKDLLKSMLYPDYGAPATFIRYLEPDDREHLSFFSSLRWDDDCLIGYLDGDLDFVVVACGSARLTHWGNGDAHDELDQPTEFL